MQTETFLAIFASFAMVILYIAFRHKSLKIFKKYLKIFVVTGYAFAIAYGVTLLLPSVSFLKYGQSTQRFLKSIYAILNLGLPVLTALFFTMSFFSKQKYKNILLTGGIIKKILIFLLWLILVVAIFYISFVLLSFVGQNVTM